MQSRGKFLLGVLACFVCSVFLISSPNRSVQYPEQQHVFHDPFREIREKLAVFYRGMPTSYTHQPRLVEEHTTEYPVTAGTGSVMEKNYPAIAFDWISTGPSPTVAVMRLPNDRTTKRTTKTFAKASEGARSVTETAVSMATSAATPGLDFEFTVLNGSFCDNLRYDLFLLVIVHSAPGHFHNRQLIRQTWANPAWKTRHKFDVLFVLGTSIASAVNAKVTEESHQYGDIVQHSLLDTYRNLTYKNLAGLIFLRTYCKVSDFQYILKTDDDMFVYPRPLVAHLQHEVFCNRSIESTILCAEVQPKEIVQRDKKNKWYIPWNVYGEKVYPPYCYGGGYVLTRDLIEKFIETAKSVPYYWIDDVYFTGFVAKKVGNVKHIQLPGQNPIRGYTCNADCMKKNKRWFLHTLQRVDLLTSYYRPLKAEGVTVIPESNDCTVPVTKAKAKPKLKKSPK